MGIIRHDFPRSEGLEKEMMLHDKSDGHQEVSLYATPEEFIRSWPNKLHQFEVETVSALFKPSSAILDIGAGVGHTSLYLARAGHRVTVVEPAYAMCRVIDLLAEKFNLDISIHQCSIEHFSIDPTFDICVFNASFHHCDDPRLALERCHALLPPGGSIYLINEQVLKFYKSKKWYERMRRSSPEKVCDYGGNEHNYRLHEYRNLLRASHFVIEQEKVPTYYLFPKKMIATSIYLNDTFKKESNKELYSDFNLFLRFIFYIALKRLVTITPCLAVLKRLSLIGVTFVARKT